MQRTGKYTHKNEYCTKANDRLTAVKRKPDGLLDLGKVRLSARLPYGNGLRALPCTRKGHRPLTHINGKRDYRSFQHKKVKIQKSLNV